MKSTSLPSLSITIPSEVTLIGEILFHSIAIAFVFVLSFIALPPGEFIISPSALNSEIAGPVGT
jgi:hypothetical protein